MCGIFGYIGKEAPLSVFLEGLARLEYRGYDSCGVVGATRDNFFFRKRQGKISQLQKELRQVINMKFSSSILHTRWATHGIPNKINAHPHLCCDRQIAVVHNGIIENYLSLKEELIKEKHKFLSDTDSEVIVHLIEKFCRENLSLEDAVFKSVERLKGSFALGVISRVEPDKIVAVRNGSPLIIGLGKHANFIASDTLAILPFTRNVIYLKDQEISVLKKGEVKLFNFKKEQKNLKTERIGIKSKHAQKGEHKHFMFKEILEQPDILKKMFSLYIQEEKIVFPEVSFKEKYFKKIEKIYIAACGTAYHAGYVGKYLLEKYCNLDVEIDTSSEFRYRKFTLGKEDLLLAISQSGETADTLAVVKEVKKRGAKILSICNVLGSSLVKESDSLIYTLAGPEIGVASTKAYTAQIFAIYLFTIYLARLKGRLDKKEIRILLSDLEKIPVYIKTILREADKIKEIAKRFSKFGCFLFLGRGVNYPSALEGALKLKEISYIPAEGYPAGEMKHGPIALIDEYRAVVCIAPRNELYEKMVSNIQEIKARRGKVLGIINHADKEVASLSDEVIMISEFNNQDFTPFLTAVCLQLFAYFMARNLGCEIDQPRNLAKSVTVE